MIKLSMEVYCPYCQMVHSMDVSFGPNNCMEAGCGEPSEGGLYVYRDPIILSRKETEQLDLYLSKYHKMLKRHMG